MNLYPKERGKERGIEEMKQKKSLGKRILSMVLCMILCAETFFAENVQTYAGEKETVLLTEEGTDSIVDELPEEPETAAQKETEKESEAEEGTEASSADEGESVTEADTALPKPEETEAEPQTQTETETEPELKPVSNEQTDSSASGTCGDGVNWSYADGVLTISGSGQMDDSNVSPFISLEIVTVHISDGITRIGSNAFAWCDKLESIEIPDSVTEIGSYAFKECSELTSVKLSKGLTTLEKGAFFDCKKLDSIYIPKSLSLIYSYSTPSDQVFQYCPLSEIEFEEGIEKIPNSMFIGSSIKSITIPGTVTKIGQYAFYDCDSLESVTISDSVTEIEAYAFGKCELLSSVKWSQKLSTLGEGAFYGCAKLKSIYVPKSLVSISVRGWYGAFSGCPLSTITFEEGIEEIPDNLFYYADIESITIPDSVTKIGQAAFSNCSALTEVNLSKNLTQLEEYAFYNCAKLDSVNIPKSLTTVGGSADGLINGPFHGCPLSRKIEFEEGIEAIPDAIFEGANITSVTIPATVTRIGIEAFSNCKLLESIDIPDSVTEIGSSAFRSCSVLTSVKLPKDLTQLNAGTFNYCEKLDNINIPKLETIGQSETKDKSEAIFLGCPLSQIQFAEGTEAILANMFKNAAITSITIPETVTRIGDSAFEDCGVLKTIEIPNSVTEIGSHAFKGCSELINVKLPQGLSKVSDETFCNCTKLESISFPNSVTEIGGSAFYNCSSLKGDLELWMMTSQIGINAFYGCQALTSVKIPNRYTSIGNGAFSGCGSQSVDSVEIPNMDTTDGNSSQFVIKGQKGSTAEKYAEENEIAFNALDDGSGIEIEGFDLGMTEIKGPVIKVNNHEFTLFSYEGGASIPIGSTDVSFDSNLLDGTFKVTIGMGDFDLKNYNDAKSLYKKIKSGQNGQKVLSDLKNLKKKMKSKKIAVGPELEGQIAGYIEFQMLPNGGCDFKEGGLIFEGKAGVSSLPYRLPPVPVVYITVGIEGSAEGGLIFKPEIAGFPIKPEGNVKVAFKPSVGAGIGDEKVLCAEASLSGELEAALKIPVSELAKALEVSLNAAVEIKAVALGYDIVDYKYNFLECKLYPEEDAANDAAVLEPEILAQPVLMEETYAKQAAFTESSEKKLTLSALNTTAAQQLNAGVELKFENIYPYNDAKLIAVENGQYMLLWIGDTGAKTGVNRTSLLYTVYDGTKWSETAQIEDMGTLNAMPEAFSMGGKVWLIWQRGSQVLGENASFEETAKTVDLYYSVYENGTFSKPERCKSEENTVYEMGQSICAKDNLAAAAWMENTENSSLQEAGTNRIYLKNYADGSWTDAVTVTETAQSVIGIETAVADGKPAVIYALLGNEGSDTIELAWNETHRTITGNMGNVYDSVIYYVSDGQLHGYDIAAGNDVTYEAAVNGDFQVTGNGSSLYLVTELKSGAASSLYCYELDKETGKAVKGAVVWEKDRYIADFDAAVGTDGRLLCAVNSFDLIPAEGGVGSVFDDAGGDLEVVSLSEYSDLAIDEAAWADAKTAFGGAPVTFYAEAQNNSLQAISGMEAVITCGGSEIARVALEDEIGAGESRELAIPVTLPDTMAGTDFVITVSVQNDDNAGNNTAAVKLGGADLALKNFEVKEEVDYKTVSGTLVNAGTEEAQNVVVSFSANYIVMDAVTEETKALFADKTYEKLAPGESTPVEIKIPNAEWEDMYGDCVFYFDADTDSVDVDYGNNSKSVVIGADMVYAIELNHQNVQLLPGEKCQLETELVPINAPMNNVVYTSSDTAVAAVDETGLVTAVALGEAEITAAVDNGIGQTESAVCRFLIVNPEQPQGDNPGTDEPDNPDKPENPDEPDNPDKPETYSISYVLNGGTNAEGNPAQYTAESDTIVLQSPVKEGAVFAGWYTDEKFTAQITQITAGSTGNLVLYAKWIAMEVDKDGNITSIGVEVTEETRYCYTGKVWKPTVKVYDDGKLLVQGKDYKVSYKNNVKAFAVTEGLSAAALKKAPQIIVQGIGNYKTSQKIVKYFTIEPRSLEEAEITLSDSVEVKAADKLQTVKPVVKYAKKTLGKKEYTISCYKEYNLLTGELSQQADGITAAGDYYILIEAAKDSKGVYSGNYAGSRVLKVKAVTKGLALSKAKLTFKKQVDYVTEERTEEEIVAAVLTKLKIGEKTYKTADSESREIFKNTFSVESLTKDTEGNVIPVKDLLKTAGQKTIRITGKTDAEIVYAGSVKLSFTVKGKKLSKNMVELTFDPGASKAVTSTVYTGKELVPSITVKSADHTDKLTEGTDYQISYLYKNAAIERNKITDAGSYTAVIEGRGIYAGTVRVTFKILPMSVSEAYTKGMLTIQKPEENVVQNLAGAKCSYLFYFDTDGDSGTAYEPVLLKENTDYTISYQNNKKVSDEAKAVVKGKGNFKGSLDSKTAKELQFSIKPKALDSEDIAVLLKSVSRNKKGEVTKTGIELYDNGKKIPTGEYTTELSVKEKVTVTIKAKMKNYVDGENPRTITFSADIVNISDSKKVQISKPGNQYYSGTQIKPVITVKAGENNLQEGVQYSPDYGKNLNVGSGTVIVNGIPENGYCGTKKVTFKILPKWLKWIFN